MNFVIAIFIGLIGFLIGTSVGGNTEPSINFKDNYEEMDEDLKKLQKEYENFLNYDGSVQE